MIICDCAHNVCILNYLNGIDQWIAQIEMKYFWYQYRRCKVAITKINILRRFFLVRL